MYRLVIEEKKEKLPKKRSFIKSYKVSEEAINNLDEIIKILNEKDDVNKSILIDYILRNLKIEKGEKSCLIK